MSRRSRSGRGGPRCASSHAAKGHEAAGGPGGEEADRLFDVFVALEGLHRCSSRDEAVAFAVELADRVMCHRTVVGLAVDAAEDRVVPVAACGEDADDITIAPIPLTGTVLARADREGCPVAADGADGRAGQRLFGNGARAVLCAPVAHEGRTFGAVALTDGIRTSSWPRADVDLLAYLTSHVGQYIAESLPSPEPWIDAHEAADRTPAPRRSLEPSLQPIAG